MKTKVTDAEIDLVLELATPKQLKKVKKAVKTKCPVYQNHRNVGSFCPNGCGSVRNAKAMKRHLREECRMPLQSGDASTNWMAAALADNHSEGPYDAGFPRDTTAKCEIILGSGVRYTSVLIRVKNGIKLWDPNLMSVGVIRSEKVLAWKVQEHFA